MCGFFNLWFIVYLGFVLCGSFANICTCIHCVIVSLILCIFILICFVWTTVKSTATE